MKSRLKAGGVDGLEDLLTRHTEVFSADRGIIFLVEIGIVLVDDAPFDLAGCIESHLIKRILF